MKHVISALVQNKPGVLAHVAGMFAARAFNIDSLAVGRTDDPNLSRMTIVVVGGNEVLEQVRKQLGKIVSVVKIQDFAGRDIVARDLMLINIHCRPEKRAEIQALVSMFEGKVVDIGPKNVMVEISGPESKMEAFIDACRHYGIKATARTGTIAMPRYRKGEKN
ncbi:acetolactate synthase small subunit [Sedimentisphaera salicampi]|uniref:Acetolactate synthase small subunit n=1 Tax=Sedimentisphaera salicampi TaxID=1941349 RepID=A0A1W6LLX1_9BACT|nr:acetolactate synthase small subunit [Sedimentisphaera salicampi]ARN56765.1 Acetolactate synthase small subunit [Sedimentisphaera salicampi]OXU15207.1 Acetolactate synthase small subunit [Sedimentisphaera salicampi]